MTRSSCVSCICPWATAIDSSGSSSRSLLGALFDRPHLVVHVEHLAAAQGLAQHRLLDERRIVFAHESSDRQAPRRWRGNDRQVAQPAERHVQRARYRRRGQGQDVDLGAQRLDRVLLAHAEAVLLVDDQQAQVGKSDVALQQLVRADENVDLAGLEATPHVPCIRGALEARQHLDAHGPAGEAVAEGVVVLLRQQRGRHQHRDLAPLAVAMKAARMATSVLPKPTSPQTRRSMTPGPHMSRSTAAIAAAWSGVSSKGKAAAKRS
jgi:hypothetical protein